jgi:hypothetical protein
MASLTTESLLKKYSEELLHACTNDKETKDVQILLLQLAKVINSKTQLKRILLNFSKNTTSELRKFPDIRVESLHEMDEPIYEGSSVTVRNAMLIILYFVISCNLAVTYVSKLPILLHYLLPEDKNLKHTKYLFFKYFNNSARDMKRFHACRTCRKLVSDSSVCFECEEVTDCHFLAQKPSELLTNRLQDGEYWNKCQYFIDNYKYNIGTYSDIYDGSTYKKIGLEVSKNKIF